MQYFCRVGGTVLYCSIGACIVGGIISFKIFLRVVIAVLVVGSGTLQKQIADYRTLHDSIMVSPSSHFSPMNPFGHDKYLLHQVSQQIRTSQLL